jgi:hypothetical protein
MFISSDQRCKKIDLQVLDGDLNVTKELIVSIKNDRIYVTPKDPTLERDYNFTLNATLDKGNFLITSNKTLKVIN